MSNPTWFDPTDYNLPDAFKLPAGWVLSDPSGTAHALDAGQRKRYAALIERQAAAIVHERLDDTVLPETLKPEMSRSAAERRNRHDHRRRFHEIVRWAYTLTSTDYLNFRLMQEAIHGEVDGVDVWGGAWWAPDGRGASLSAEHSAELVASAAHVIAKEAELIREAIGDEAEQARRLAGVAPALKASQRQRITVYTRRSQELRRSPSGRHVFDLDDMALWGENNLLRRLRYTTRRGTTGGYTPLVAEYDVGGIEQTEHTAEIPAGHNRFSFLIDAVDSRATYVVKVYGASNVAADLTTQTAGQFSGDIGDSRKVEVIVTSELGTVRTYTITLTRAST